MTFENEQCLIQAAKLGDMVAFETLYRETRDFILKRAHFLSRGQDAEDIVQETYIRAWRALSSFRGECCFATWLYRILYNEVIRLHRQSRVNSNLTLLPPTLAQSAQDLDSNIALDQSLASIRHSERELVHRALQGYSNSEIAQQLGVSIAAIKSRKYRVRRMMQAMLLAN